MSSICMLPVSGGRFVLESYSKEYADKARINPMKLSDYAMSETLITQKQYSLVMGTNPSWCRKDPDADCFPVEMITWFDAVEFCNKLSEQESFDTVYTIMNRNPATGYPILSADVTIDMTKDGYRLPTEAEWEYAAQGGAKSRRYSYPGSNDIDAVAWYEGNSYKVVHPVRLKQPNELGLYDMLGNVWEWCQDRYNCNHFTGFIDTMNASLSVYRLLFGGPWYCYTEGYRFINRSYSSPSHRYNDIGFRIVQSML